MENSVICDPLGFHIFRDIDAIRRIALSGIFQETFIARSVRRAATCIYKALSDKRV